MIDIVLYLTPIQSPAGQARLSGLEADLNLTDTQYQTALSIVFVLYITMQVPSNLMLAWCGRPRIYLGTFITLWGAVSACTGATHNYAQLVGVRFILGGVEAPFFSGALLLLSKWYTRRELSVRMALLYAGSILSNAFAGLISAAILGSMEGVHGIRAWRWLFIIEGVITVGVGLLMMMLLPDFPHNTTTFFSKEEREIAVQRLTEDTGESDIEGEMGGTPWQGFILSVKDPKVWLLTLMLFGAVLGCAFNAFFPTIVQTLGYGKIETLLLTCPLWMFAFICVYLNALHADRTGERYWHMSVPLAVGILGFIIASATRNTGARFFAMFIMASSYAGYVIILSWSANTIPRPPYKRAVALAMINCISNTGNIVGSFTWPSHWGPSYWQSCAISACCFLVTIIAGAFLRRHLVKLNEELDRTRGGVGEGKLPQPDAETVETPEERVLRAKAEFRYLL